MATGFGSEIVTNWDFRHGTDSWAAHNCTIVGKQELSGNYYLEITGGGSYSTAYQEMIHLDTSSEYYVEVHPGPATSNNMRFKVFSENAPLDGNGDILDDALGDSLHKTTFKPTTSRIKIGLVVGDSETCHYSSVSIKQLITENTDYDEYLPVSAGVGFPRHHSKSLLINGINTKRYYYDRGTLYYFTATRSGSVFDIPHSKTYVQDDATEYGEGTYVTGDIVKVTNLALKYQYTGIEELIITSSPEVYEYHPSAIDVNGVRVNASIWLCIGSTDEYSISDGSEDSYYEAPDDDKGVCVSFASNIISSDFTYWESPYINGPYRGVGIFGVKALAVRVQVIDPMSGVVSDFTIDFSDKSSLILTHVNEDYRVNMYLYPIYEDVINITRPSVTHGVEFTYQNLGDVLTGLQEKRISEFQKVESDGMIKQKMIKTYRSFSGSVIVDSTEIKKVDYFLGKATQERCVFYSGAGELYDNRSYLCNIKYSVPAVVKSKSIVTIDGTAFANRIENIMIADDSLTDWS